MFSLNTKWVSPNVLLFGKGTSGEVGAQTSRWCKHVLLVSGGGALRKNGTLDALERSLEAHGVRVTHYAGIASEPTVQDVDEGAALAKANGCDGVLAVGGGSVLDVGKSVSGMLTNEGSVLDYIADVGKGLTLKNTPAPLISLPTTAGTGAETTNNAVLIDRAENWKRSLRDDKLISKVAIVDAALQMGLSAKSTAYAGMDAICQLIEAYTSANCSSMSAAAILEGLRRCAKALPDACNDVLEAREAMAYAAMLSGFVITQAGVGAVHGLSAGLGAALGLGHGLGCAILLPHIMRLNAQACPEKCVPLAEAITGKAYAVADAGEAAADAIAGLNARVGIPDSLKGIAQKEDIARIWDGSNPATVGKNIAQRTERQWKDMLLSLIES